MPRPSTAIQGRCRSIRCARIRVYRCERARSSRLAASGANTGTAGNLSVRVPSGGYIITPSGKAYDAMHPDDLVYMGETLASFSG